jgi:Mg2+ and Co2+ transporter CorA
VHPRAALEFVRQERKSKDQGWSWVHLKRDHELLPDWFQRVESLPDDAVYELSTDDSQPHCTTFSPGKNVVLRLRGLRRRINNAAEALAEVEDGQFINDLFSITILVQPDKVLSTADTSLECVRQMREQLADSIRAGEPAFPTPGAVVSQLVEYVIDDALKLVNGLQDSLDAFEERDEESLGGDGDQQQRLQDILWHY